METPEREPLTELFQPRWKRRHTHTERPKATLFSSPSLFSVAPPTKGPRRRWSAAPSVKRSTWKLAAECDGCAQKFSLTTSRHHCRKCGRSVCAACSRCRMLLPGEEKAAVRVCDRCAKDCLEAAGALERVEAETSRRVGVVREEMAALESSIRSGEELLQRERNEAQEALDRAQNRLSRAETECREMIRERTEYVARCEGTYAREVTYFKEEIRVVSDHAVKESNAAIRREMSQRYASELAEARRRLIAAHEETISRTENEYANAIREQRARFDSHIEKTEEAYEAPKRDRGRSKTGIAPTQSAACAACALM